MVEGLLGAATGLIFVIMVLLTAHLNADCKKRNGVLVVGLMTFECVEPLRNRR